MFGTGCIRRDIRKVDLGLHYTGELDLGFLRSFPQTLQRLTVTAQVNALLSLEFIRSPINNTLIPIITTKVSITVCGFYFDHTFAYLQHGDIEGTTTQVEDQDRFIFFLIEAVSKCR